MRSMAAASPGQILARLLRMLRPHWARISIAVVLLLLSLPAELFPGLAWMYVTDALIIGKPTRSSYLLGKLFSFDGLITGKIHLLFSTTLWMMAVYLLAESCGTISAYLMNIVAQRFTRARATRFITSFSRKAWHIFKGSVSAI